MSELLAPVGNKEAFYAAIANGCNAIYLGLNKHNARAYADNFNLDNLKEYVDFAHLRNVKVYVTLNTIIYDNELEEIYKMVDGLAAINVDAIIVQDLAVLLYTANKYKSIEVHASTQMGIDDYLGAKLVKDLGVSRIVLARETPLSKIKEIKDKVDIEVETFIHGALCVSYSGNCFMSSSLGERSGNRGRCAGCCRKLYTLVDIENKINVKQGYLLSMKDLNLSSYIKDMSFIDSFKIEGRMKDESYVALVTNTYRKIIDNENVDIKNLDKMFNRTFTKGFINNEDSLNITNIARPNNNGYLIGKVVKILNNKIWIKLFSEVNKGDLIRIEDASSFNDETILLSKILDPDFKVIEKSSKTIIIYTEKKIKLNSLVYKTKDVLLNTSINVGNKIKEYKKIGILMDINIKKDEPILLKIKYLNHVVYQKSDYVVSNAITTPTSKDDIINHLAKLNDTPYYLENININMDEDIFIPIKVINDIRRLAIEKLNNSRLNLKIKLNKNPLILSPKNNVETPLFISVEVHNDKQYEVAKRLGIENIYYKNIVNRNNATYVDGYDEILIGGLSSISYYKNKNVKLISDYSLNVTNYISATILSSLGVDTITLSNELNKDQINNLVANYIEHNKTYPNFELIVYGRSKLMHSKYCPLRRLNMCGKCKSGEYALKDNFETFPLLFNDDCTINLLNSKTLNLLDDLSSIKGINKFRLVFTNEKEDEVERIINIAISKLNKTSSIKCFDGKNHTRGNFKKELL